MKKTKICTWCIAAAMSGMLISGCAPKQYENFSDIKGAKVTYVNRDLMQLVIPELGEDEELGLGDMLAGVESVEVVKGDKSSTAENMRKVMEKKVTEYGMKPVLNLSKPGKKQIAIYITPDPSDANLCNRLMLGVNHGKKMDVIIVTGKIELAKIAKLAGEF